MSVGAAMISTLDQETVKFVSKGRIVDFEGYEVNDDKVATFKAGVVPSGSKFKKGDQTGTVGVDDNELFACGKIDVQLDDELEFCGTVGKVVEVEFWGPGGFTRIVMRTLTRKGVTVA